MTLLSGVLISSCDRTLSLYEDSPLAFFAAFFKALASSSCLSLTLLSMHISFSYSSSIMPHDSIIDFYRSLILVSMREIKSLTPKPCLSNGMHPIKIIRLMYIVITISYCSC